MNWSVQLIGSLNLLKYLKTQLESSDFIINLVDDEYYLGSDYFRKLKTHEDVHCLAYENFESSK